MQTKKFLQVARYLCLIGPILGTIFTAPAGSYPTIIALSLLVVTNSQLRLLTKNKNLIIISLIIDVLLISAVSSRYLGFFYLILLVTLIDACFKLRAEALPMAVLASTGLIFSLTRIYSLELVLIITGIYLVLFFILLQLRHELYLREDVELLYDQIRKNNYELENAGARLLAYSKQVEQIAQLEERNRISRELHDSIGHSLTGILMQVDAARQLVKINQDTGLELINSAYQNISKSIETLKDTVQKIRPTAFQFHFASLQDMADKFSLATQVNIELGYSGTPCQLYPSVETVLYQNIQEALTNAVRHGKANNIQIHLTYYPDHTEVLIADDGVGAEHVTKGFGLTGMEERIELIGGSLNFNGVNGFTIHMSIPREEL